MSRGLCRRKGTSPTAPGPRPPPGPARVPVPRRERGRHLCTRPPRQGRTRRTPSPSLCRCSGWGCGSGWARLPVTRLCWGRGRGRGWEGGGHASSRPQLAPAGGILPRNGPGCTIGTRRATGRGRRLAATVGSAAGALPGEHDDRLGARHQDPARLGHQNDLIREGSPSRSALLAWEPEDPVWAICTAARQGTGPREGRTGREGRVQNPGRSQTTLQSLAGLSRVPAGPSPLSGTHTLMHERQVRAPSESNPGTRPPGQNSNQNPREVSSTKPRRQEATRRVERMKDRRGPCLPGGQAHPWRWLLRPVGRRSGPATGSPGLRPNYSLITKGNSPAPVGKQHLNPSQSDTHNWLR